MSQVSGGEISSAALSAEEESIDRLLSLVNRKQATNARTKIGREGIASAPARISRGKYGAYSDVESASTGNMLGIVPAHGGMENLIPPAISVCRDSGFEPPTICTPSELMEASHE